MNFFLYPLIVIFYFLVFVSPARAQESSFNHSALNDVLGRFVNEQGRVDYKGLKAEPELLDVYLFQLQSLDPEAVEQWPREARLALWLNAYHAALLKIVADHYPIESIQDIPSVWDHQFVDIGGFKYSLNQVRSSQLIASFRDEKIHAALSCAAVSCPRLRQEAFTGPRVEGQLYLITREWVNQQAYVDIVPQDKKVAISKIFKWYGQDFQLDFGSVENQRNFSPSEYAVLSFIAYYLDDADKIRFLEEGSYKVKYLSFDWSLNDWGRS